MTRALLIPSLMLLAGCASSQAPMAAPRDGDRNVMQEEPAKKSEASPVKHRRPKPPPLAGGPHDKRAGARTSTTPTSPPREVTFVAPKRPPAPVVGTRRPTLDGPFKLAVVLVRDGKLSTDRSALLRLASRLDDDAAVRSVTALPRPKATSVKLDDLAASARAAGRSLLLVSIATNDLTKETLVRTGWLLYTPLGKGKRRTLVLARFDVRRGATIPTTTGATHTGLLARLERAHARLED